MDSISLFFHFPWGVKIIGYGALALTHGTNYVNREETNRCSGRDCVWIEEDPQNGERILRLSVRRPSINHSYVLLYELGD